MTFAVLVRVIGGLRPVNEPTARDRARNHGHDFLQAASDLFAHWVLLRLITASSSGSGFRLGDLCFQCDQGLTEGLAFLDLDDSPSFAQRSHDETLPFLGANLYPSCSLNPVGNVGE